MVVGVQNIAVNCTFFFPRPGAGVGGSVGSSGRPVPVQLIALYSLLKAWFVECLQFLSPAYLMERCPSFLALFI